jgi:1-acyl-sn-glycerol-3-phosphate acyltransferase
MSLDHPQLEMEPLYGFCHAVIKIISSAAFRGDTAGLENLPETGGYIVAANHASLLDPPIVGLHLPRQVNFFARKTLWKPGLAAWWLDGVGTIPVDRDGGTDVTAIKRVLQALKRGHVIIFFPEGTRTADGQLQTPKPGVGLIACKTGVPVVPARVFNSANAFGRDGRLHLGTPVDVTYGRPLRPADYDDPLSGKERYQRAANRIMAAIGQLDPPPIAVL